MPYATTFAAFLTRAHDFIRMAAISGSGINLVGSHAGVSIGQDGPSQMALEDLAMFRALYGTTVLYPCDANQTAKLVATMADLEGIRYLRTSRGDTPVIYSPTEEFPVGGSKVLRASDEDRLTLVAAGVTLHEALAAAESLDRESIQVRVIDLYSVKPVDRDTLREAAEQTGCLVTVEDHREEGGIGDAVLDAFLDGRPVPRLVRLAVRTMPGSATPPSNCTPRASTRSRSRRRRGCWWRRRSCAEPYPLDPAPQTTAGGSCFLTAEDLSVQDGEPAVLLPRPLPPRLGNGPELRGGRVSALRGALRVRRGLRAIGPQPAHHSRSSSVAKVQVSDVAVMSLIPAVSAHDLRRRPAAGSPPLARATRRYRSSQSLRPGTSGYQAIAE